MESPAIRNLQLENQRDVIQDTDTGPLPNMRLLDVEFDQFGNINVSK